MQNGESYVSSLVGLVTLGERLLFLCLKNIPIGVDVYPVAGGKVFVAQVIGYRIVAVVFFVAILKVVHSSRNLTE